MSLGTLSYPSSEARRPVAFGKYLLGERIGAGGMAEVFRAVAVGPEGFQRTLVIKRILPHLSQDAAFVRMFIDEARLSGLLSHPNLVQIFEFGKVGESFFIAMEHVHGRTLSAVQTRLAESGRLAPVGATAEIGRQICVGLQYAHTLQSTDGKPLGIVHRDITPSNLMLAFHGGVKILDFGIARVADDMRASRTQTGTVKGKISYMAPEQLQNDSSDHRVDIFSLGIVLHEMLTGRRLFRGSSDLGASRKVLDAPIPLPSTLNPAVPAGLDRVVMRALERNPSTRYQTAGEMAAELDELIQDAHLSSREHIKLVQDLFPDQAAATDVGIMLPADLPRPSAPMAAPAAGELDTRVVAGRDETRTGDVGRTPPRGVPGRAPGRRSTRATIALGVVSAAAIAALFFATRGHKEQAAAAPATLPAAPALAAPVHPAPAPPALASATAAAPVVEPPATVTSHRRAPSHATKAARPGAQTRVSRQFRDATPVNPFTM